MSKSGIPCYRNGGCGPYERLSCRECPASKSDYLQIDTKSMTNIEKHISKVQQKPEVS